MSIVVSKFGGTSVATPTNLKQVEKIITLNSQRRLIVVSAPGKGPGITIKVTDLLIAIFNKVSTNQPCAREIADLKKRFLDLYTALDVPVDTIQKIIDDIDTRVSTPTKDSSRQRDLIVAAGEDYNAQLFAEYLKTRSINAIYVSPAQAGLIVTEDFGNAQPTPLAIEKMGILKTLCEKSVVIFPGFFGITENGEIATFSRGGSDLTGAICAQATDASEYENWTDVNGIFCTNPKIVENPIQIEALTYKEMRELSYIGFNVFHEEAVIPTMSKKIPIRLRNTNNLDNNGTLIVAQRLPSERDVIGIASKSGYCSFTLEKFLMNREKGFGRRLLGIFENRGISYEHCPSGVDNISVILDQSQLTPETINAIVRDIETELNPDKIRTEFGIALVAVVGEGLLHKVGVLATAAASLSRAGVNIKIANQGSSEISIIFGIDANNEHAAVNALYQEFFKN